jgi:hypothetical protein
MGALVARYFVECLGGASKVERMILMGGPHAGTPRALTSLLSGPDLLPLGMMNARLRDLIASFPSWYQILPTYSCATDQRGAFDVLTDDTWLEDHARALLRDARRFRGELAHKSSVHSVCVFGYDVKTITSVTTQREIGGRIRGVDLVVTPRGDGTVPETSGVLEGAEIHPVRQHHGSLYSDTDVKMRLKLELARGTART